MFHGRNAASFSKDFAALLEVEARVHLLPDELADDAQRGLFRKADVIVGNRIHAALPSPERLQLYHVSATGTDGIDLDSLPSSVTVCNCYGHEPAIAEYVMAALLSHQTRLMDADRLLRKGDWSYRSGAAANVHGEIVGRRLGLLGFGHIARAIAGRARAFGMEIHAPNRSPVRADGLVDRTYGLGELAAFYGAVDFVVVSVPLTAETRGLVEAEAFRAMRPDAVLVNVGRGPVVDERALYEALSGGRIAAAVIDTWYRYPERDGETLPPSAYDFASLPNVVMTPHMSGWTDGTIRRRRQTIADNINRFFSGRPCTNVVRTSE